MNYQLKNAEQEGGRRSWAETIRLLAGLLTDERHAVSIALLAVLSGSLLNLCGPYLLGRAVDMYIVSRQYDGIFHFSLLLVLVFTGTSVAGFIQTRLMGAVGQRLLFSLRSKLFAKLQELPVAFFNANKSGDLISRINNDTDKLNQFLSQSLVQFVGNLFVISGAGIAMILLNPWLGMAALLPALGLVFFTRAVTGWVTRTNAASLQATGSLSAEVQEALQNFKVIVAFNRRDYFRKRFQEVNTENYTAAMRAGIANGVILPTFDFAGNLSQLVTLGYGIYLISMGHTTIGVLISYLAYISRFYDPLRHFASLWSTLQIALAAWDRISQILSLRSDLDVLPTGEQRISSAVLEFQNVHFRYSEDREILLGVDFALQPGKTYALVGPTGGGKTTTASLMARLYDPTEGVVLFEGKDIRSYTAEERTADIGFILQDALLFTGTVRDNILYGNPQFIGYTAQQLEEELRAQGLSPLLERFEGGLDMAVSAGGTVMSLGQRQLIAFMRAVLRKPRLLILDEATANIDTVTEQLLQDILSKLPPETTKVVIAHRLNTIADADEIFFVNAGTVVRAGSFDEAVEMLLRGKRVS